MILFLIKETNSFTLSSLSPKHKLLAQSFSSFSVDFEKTKLLLQRKVKQYNCPQFIAKDPICVPHRFSKKQDIEIAGFFAAMLAWGNRTSIINSANKIMEAMHQAPHDFLLHHQPSDLKAMLAIKHRTFNATDLLYFIEFLAFHFSKNESLETAFMASEQSTMKENLIHFHNYFFSLEHPTRTHKHISTPLKHSACKRLNMYLRWMVRADRQGVDFGIWKRLQPRHLICPLDVHVCNVAHRLGMIATPKPNWKTAEALTEILKTFDAHDPCQYDFALFGLGAEERMN